jgi:hypothetical protein
MKGRNLVEFSAIPVVILILGVLAVIMVAFDLGVWAWLVVGAVIVVMAAVVVWLVSAMHQHPAGSAAPPPARRPDDRGAGSTHRVLVVADDCATSEAFVSTIVERADGRPADARRRRLRGGAAAPRRHPRRAGQGRHRRSRAHRLARPHPGRRRRAAGVPRRRGGLRHAPARGGRPARGRCGGRGPRAIRGAGDAARRRPNVTAPPVPVRSRAARERRRSP